MITSCSYKIEYSKEGGGETYFDSQPGIGGEREDAEKGHLKQKNQEGCWGKESNRVQT